MRFYNTQHPFYCGIDLHARAMYVCILNQKGKALTILAHKLARAVYHMLKRKVAFDMQRFLNDQGRGVGELDV